MHPVQAPQRAPVLFKSIWNQISQQCMRYHLRTLIKVDFTSHSNSELFFKHRKSGKIKFIR